MDDQTVQRSQALWESGLYCAESVLLAIAERLGIQSELIPRIATGFCGGISDTGDLCGALSGAIMAIGLVAGRSSPGESAQAAYTLTRTLLDSFRQEFGAINCYELIGCDFRTEEGRRAYRQNRLGQRCRGYVGGATSIAVRLIGEYSEKLPGKEKR